ncbi:GntR family transcriptional regulator [Aquamicrobium sp. NLF2-7]|uniref:GntR family transcriptional regulator n=1 Tax=Aquamicrobium sp. NLF2-7 TaxID=2918753 RepID=UPI001EFB92C3|nr:GntR family transcriptional regulator [Aquamicrobium sp. NLF2-7]MCG8273816.1 GntR family transcriptional regulator [Aquamicrobium sp. NLF2-7]MCG8273968.1 GntR family transcriptional regulator [Aquamicrobium sp. NLF2-7]
MLEEGPDARDSDTGQNSKAGQLYGQLKSLFVLQKLPPGTRLEMASVAKRFGVSITPVREALILLANERIIAKESNRSYVTRPLVAQEVRDDYEAAFMTARYCIENRTAHFEATGLRIGGAQAASQWGVSDRLRSICQTIELLYERIAGLTGNERLVRQMMEFNDRTHYVRQLDMRNEERHQETAAAMNELVTLLEAGDAQTAVHNLKQQFHRKHELIPTLVREGNLAALESVNLFAE